MDLGVPTLPIFPKDAGDRNRTSPFAFTGNRFEFRAVGSGQSVSGPLVAMNTILADSLDWVADQLEAKLGSGVELNVAIHDIIRDIIRDHGAVVFNGNGYSSEWHEMAVNERGLLNLRTTADALPVLREQYIEDLFAKEKVLSPVELGSRFEAYSEQYIQHIEVEAKLVISMAKTIIYPAAMRYMGELTKTIESLGGMGVEFSNDSVVKIADLTKSMMGKVGELEDLMTKHFMSVEEHMQFCAQTVRPLMDQVREYADALEGEVADDLWPLPTYQEMLFIK